MCPFGQSMLTRMKLEWSYPVALYLVDLITMEHLSFMNMYHWRFDG